MMREKTSQEESEERMYFDMDFTNQNYDLDQTYRLDDSSGLSNDLDDIHLSSNLDSRATESFGQIPRSRSYSIPIQTVTQTSERNLPSTWGNYRSPSPSSQLSCSVSGTPALSASPSSSFIPRKIRQSFSNLLKRGSFSRTRSPGDEQACSDSECYNCEDRRASECSIVSPATDEVVNESMGNGLPIIPFAYPTFFMTSKNQEDVQKGIRKNLLKRLKRSFSRGRSQDYENVGEEGNGEDKSLENIVRMVKQEMESPNQGTSDEPVTRKESQSSYVEMDPGDMSSIESRRMVSEEDPYVRMEDLPIGWKKESDQPIFNLEENHETPRNSLFPMPTVIEHSKRKNNFLQTRKNKGELQMQESMERQFKRGNKHKDDYAFLDFEKNKNYVDMDKAKTKKWQFLDFNSYK